MYSSHTNLVLEDTRRYRQARLRMNNPKGYDHILRVFTRARDYGHFVTGNWERITNRRMLAHAAKVLERLANLERMG